MTAEPALIGLAHGSRDSRSAAAILDLMAAAAVQGPGVATAAAFLDLSEPDLVTVLRSLGPDEVVVVPLLFSEAFHARIDVPETVAAAGQATGVRIRTGAILGLGASVLGALRDSATAAGIRDESDIVLLAVGSSQPAANAAVAALARQWSAGRSGAVHAAFATAEPRTADVLEQIRGSGRDVGIVPLFLAPGLLLDQVIFSQAADGLRVAQPLGTALAGLVVQRYGEALRSRLIDDHPSVGAGSGPAEANLHRK